MKNKRAVIIHLPHYGSGNLRISFSARTKCINQAGTLRSSAWSCGWIDLNDKQAKIINSL